MPSKKETKPNQTRVNWRIFTFRGTHGIIVTVIREGHNDHSLNSEWGCFLLLIPFGKLCIHSPSIYGVEQNGHFILGMATGLGEGKFWIQT